MPKFKKGDNVRAIGLSIYGADLRGKELIVDDPEYPSCDGVVVKVTGDYLMRPTDLEHVKKSHAARILTEKVTIEGMPCRKILGFEGILSQEELPEKYNNGLPEFSFDKDERSAHRFVFDGNDLRLHHSELSRGVLHFHVPDADPKIKACGFCLTYMNIGDILPEKTFQQILVWLKRAGSRLAKIRKQEKAAWSGKETVEI